MASAQLLDPPAEADQATDVWPRQLRSTKAARPPLGLTPAHPDALARSRTYFTKSETEPK